jgi:hypothetical protein
MNGSITYTLKDSGGVNVSGSPIAGVSKAPLTSGTYAGPVPPATPAYFATLTLPAIGQYTQSAVATFTAVIPDDQTTANCTGSATIATVNRPYFKVLGGDIVSVSTTAAVEGWNQFGGTYPGCAVAVVTNGNCGSGVEGLLLAANTTAGIKSGLGLSGPKAATLSNTAGSATWGGAFGSTAGFFTAPAYPVAADSGATLAATGIPANQSVVHYHNGSVTITGNVTYNPAAYGNIKQIPHFRLIATGDIYIAPGVTQLDGEYISTGGSIYTCHNGAWGSPIDTSITNIYTACEANNLVVNGALIAKSIHLTRVKGTLRNAVETDTTTNRANIAEIIQFSPELYLSPGTTTNVSVGGAYDKLSALPPLF